MHPKDLPDIQSPQYPWEAPLISRRMLLPQYMESIERRESFAKADMAKIASLIMDEPESNVTYIDA